MCTVCKTSLFCRSFKDWNFDSILEKILNLLKMFTKQKDEECSSKPEIVLFEGGFWLHYVCSCLFLSLAIWDGFLIAWVRLRVWTCIFDIWTFAPMKCEDWSWSFSCFLVGSLWKPRVSGNVLETDTVLEDVCFNKISFIPKYLLSFNCCLLLF